MKETTKTASYLGVIIGGLGVTGAIFYIIFKELFSSESPNNIFSAALDKCIENTKVQDMLGAPIKGHGEESRRGRHRHVRLVFKCCKFCSSFASYPQSQRCQVILKKISHGHLKMVYNWLSDELL